jgi:glycosyltransferase involved in cell wall biosynthesis
MAEPRRIGVVTTSFPRWRGDPSGAFVLGLAVALAERGHRVEVLAPEPREVASWRSGEAWLGGVEVRAIPYARPRWLESLFYGAGVPDNVARHPALVALAPLAAASILAAVRRRAPSWDAVVSEWLAPSALAVAALGERRPAHFAIAHSADVHLLSRLPFAGVVAARIAAGADRVGFVAEILRREFCDLLGPARTALFARKLVLAPMGVDAVDLATPRARGEIREELDLRGFTVLFLGRLVPIKGADVLVDAAAFGADLTIVIAGDGPERAALERRARARGVDVRFLGAVDGRRRAELLAACDVVAVPSRVLGDGRHEGMPTVVIEAMSSGVPVVATASGGIPEVVRDGESGLLVPPDDPGALASAIARLRADGALRAASVARGREIASARSWGAVASSVESAFDAALEARAGPGRGTMRPA